MNRTHVDARPVVAQLPQGAPCVRVTAGAGTATEKCWNLSRCATLIGSTRKAHIVLHDAVVARAHCVIVNTGTDVLLKDLFTEDGTLCNGRAVSLTALHDGDVIELGENSIHVSISGAGPSVGDAHQRPAPTRMAMPVKLFDLDTNMRWTLQTAVAMIGSGEPADVQLVGEDLDYAHAVLFRLGRGLAVYDLTGRGIRVDGQPVMVSLIREGQVLQIGSSRLHVGEPELRADGSAPRKVTREPAVAPVAGSARPPVTPTPPAGSRSVEPAAVPASRPAAAAPAKATATPRPAVATAAAVVADRPAAPVAPEPRDVPTPDTTAPADAPAKPLVNESLDPIMRSLADLEQDIASLQTSISDSWRRLNCETDRHVDPTDDINPSPEDLMKRARDLDAVEAGLRGQLHDLTRCQEQLAERERELAAQAARIHEERLKFFQDQAAWAKRKAEITRRASELDRRERLLAERSARPQG
jgi:hypothetical protein